MKHDRQSKKAVDLDISIDDIKNDKLYKIRVTSFIDGDIYEWLKQEASCGKGRGRYQTFMNDILREYMNKQKQEHSTKQSKVKTIKSKDGRVMKLTKKDMDFLKSVLED